MSTKPPVYMGTFEAIHTGDIRDLYLDISADLATGETISSVVFTVTNSAGATVAGVVTDSTVSDTRVDFRITAPATAGNYTLTCVFTINDGQKLTRHATITLV